MVWLLRFGLVAALWAVARRPTNKLMASRLEKLAWPDRLRLIWNLSQDDRLPIWSRAVLIGPAAYLLSPIDLLPDFIPFLGRLDDSVVFSAGMDLATLLIPRQIIEQHLDQIAPLRP